MKDSIKIFSVFALCCLIWGSTWLGIKASLYSLTPFYSVGFRFVIASFLVLLFVRYKGIKIQTDKVSINLYLIMGFFSYVIPYGLVYWAEQFVPSGLAAVLFAVYPFFVLLFSYMALPGESIGFYKVLGIVLGFGGILVIFSENIGGDISSYLLGMTALVLSGITQAANVVVIKKYGHYLNPLSMNFIPMIIAGIFFLIIAFLFEDFNLLVFDTNAYLSVLYLALFGTVITFTSYYWLLKRVNVVILSLIAFINPMIALLLGWFIYNEQLSSRHLWGSILVLTGLLWANLGNAIFNTRRRKKTA
ncbi:MAG: EamA family transporter [Ignavibacteria bacterium]|nr:EamA family transporter [Ignavibacteria bacterium]